MFPDRWHPDTEEQLTHRMQRLHALPLLLGAQAEVYPGHPDVSKAAREFVPVLKTSCPLQRKSKSCTWTDQKATWMKDYRNSRYLPKDLLFCQTILCRCVHVGSHCNNNKK